MYRKTRVELTPILFAQLQDIWAIKDRGFDRMKDRWARQTHGRQARGQGGLISMADWVPTGSLLTQQQQAMKTMDAYVMV